MATKQQLNRLKNEYENLVRGLEGNPFIYIAGTTGQPPYRYDIGYNLKGVTFDPIAKEVSYATKHEVEITLYKDYPQSPPHCELKAEIFHPNISPSKKCMDYDKSWTPATSLLDIVRHIGAVISYQEYDLTLPSDKEAAEWAVENEASLPLDKADLHSREGAEDFAHEAAEAEPQVVCTYCHEPNPVSQCSNGHHVCGHCKSQCHYCDNVTCLACPENTCAACLDRIRSFRLQIAEKVKAGDIKSAVAIGEVALKSFRNSRRLRKTLDRLRTVRELVEDTTELKQLKCFVGIAKACDELRTLGFFNEMTAGLEAEASDMIKAADELVAKGKKVLQSEHAPELALKEFSDALTIVADHPSASKLVREAKGQINDAIKQIELAEECLAQRQYEPAIRAASRAASLDVNVKSRSEELIETARKFQLVEPGRKKERVVHLGTTVVALILIVVTGFVLWEHLGQKGKYDKILEKVNNEQSLEGKIEVLRAYVNSHEEDSFTKDAEDRIWNLETQLRTRDYEIAVRDGSVFIDMKDYEGAETIYEEYLLKYPNTIHTQELHRRLLTVLDIMNKRDDKRDYQAVLDFRESDFRERIDRYNSYLASYPKGKHRDEVIKFLVAAWKEWSSHLRKKTDSVEGGEDWDECVELCVAFREHLNDPEWSRDIDSLRTECEKRSQEERALMALIAEADSMGNDYEAARQLFLNYLEKNPESFLKETVENRIDTLDKKIRAQNQWAEVVAYVRSEEADFYKRRDRLEKYIDQNPSGSYVQGAQRELEELKERHDIGLWTKTLECAENPDIDLKKRVDSLEHFVRKNMSGKYLGNAKSKLKLLKDEQERRSWNEVALYCQTPTVSMSQRISRIEGFMSQWPSGEYAAEARAASEKLRRLLVEEQRIRRRIAAVGRTYSYNNGVITDKRTGLMWCAFDSHLELNYCLPYKSAIEYVRGLRYGGYSDWRFPSLDQLRLIYKNRPFFPTTIDGSWYWTSNQFGEYIVPVLTTKRQTGDHAAAEIESSVGCGAVRAVRGP